MSRDKRRARMSGQERRDQDNPEGFRVLVRDSPVTGTAGTPASVIDDVASQVEYILVEEFSKREFDDNLAPLYSRALVGMTVQVGGWWMDVGKPQDRGRCGPPRERRVERAQQARCRPPGLATISGRKTEKQTLT